jgi:glycosyltransferase involved in cell wall biosynthesis
LQTATSRPCLLFVLGMMPTKIGGMEKFLRSLVIALDASGWDSVLGFDGAITPEFAEYFSLPFVTLEVIDNQGRFGLAAAGKLWSTLRKHKPEVFVYAFHGVMRVFPWMAKFAGCKRVFFNDHSSRKQGMVAAPLSFPKRMVGRFLTAPVTAIVSVADFTRRTGTAFGITSAKNIVVTNGIEIKAANPEAGARLRDRYGIAPDAIVVTQVCWMVEVKGVEVMLEAAKKLHGKFPALRFLLVGGGEKLESYRALANDMGLSEITCFTGIINDPVGAGVLDASNIYGQPSKWQEACPLAVLEAMSKKLPVVASNTGGLPELVTDGLTGTLVPVGDSDRLADALEKLVENADLRQSMGEAGQADVLQKHRIETMVGRYIEIFLNRAAA